MMRFSNGPRIRLLYACVGAGALVAFGTADFAYAQCPPRCYVAPPRPNPPPDYPDTSLPEIMEFPDLETPNVETEPDPQVEIQPELPSLKPQRRNN